MNKLYSIIVVVALFSLSCMAGVKPQEKEITYCELVVLNLKAYLTHKDKAFNQQKNKVVYSSKLRQYTCMDDKIHFTIEMQMNLKTEGVCLSIMASSYAKVDTEKEEFLIKDDGKPMQYSNPYCCDPEGNRLKMCPLKERLNRDPKAPKLNPNNMATTG